MSAGQDPLLFAGEDAVLDSRQVDGDATKCRWPREGPSVCRDAAVHSERRVGIEIRRCPLGHKLTAPGALDFGAVGKPELIAYQLEALEDCEGLLGRPVRGQRERRG